MQSPTDKGGFRELRLIEPGGLFRRRPASHASYFVFCSTDGFEAYIHHRVIDLILSRGREAGGKEIIGRLGGRACLDDLGEYVLIESASLTHGADSTLSTVVANVDAQGRARRDFEEQCPAFDASGWWHTHVHLEPFYSPTDRQNQTTWTDPNTIGVVLGTTLLGEGLKVFRGPDSELLRLARGTARIAELRARLRRTGRTRPVWEQPPERVAPAIVREPIEAEPQHSRTTAWVWVSAAVNLAICAACIAILIATLALFVRIDTPIVVRVIDAAPAVPREAAIENKPTPSLWKIYLNILSDDPWETEE